MSMGWQNSWGLLLLLMTGFGIRSICAPVASMYKNPLSFFTLRRASTSLSDRKSRINRKSSFSATRTTGEALLPLWYLILTFLIHMRNSSYFTLYYT
jgi:hypothetical protein